MDGQEPARNYYEYYYDQNQHRRPQAPAPSAPPSTSHAVAYGSFAAVGDSTDQTRMPPISRNFDPSLHASYPMHMAHSLATAAHPVHRQTMQQIDGASGDFPEYGGTYFHPPHPGRPAAVYRIPTQSLGGYPSINSDQNVPTELHAQPAPPNVAMGPGPTPLPDCYPTEAFAPNDPAPHGGALYIERHYSSPHALGSSSHTPVHRPASLRHSVRVRDNPTSSERLCSPRESSSWAHNPGPELPHPAASSSTNPTQQDFRILHDSQAPLADSWDESSESGPSTEAAVSDMTNDMTTHGNNTTPPPAYLRTLDEMYEHFPHHNSQHQLMRARLLDVINASWRRMNEKEPDPQILLQFTSKIQEHGSERYKCLIWIEGTECGKKIPRADRMLEHLRRHIGVRPFTCDCNSEGWRVSLSCFFCRVTADDYVNTPVLAYFLQNLPCTNIKKMWSQYDVNDAVPNACAKIYHDTGGPSDVSIPILELCS